MRCDLGLGSLPWCYSLSYLGAGTVIASCSEGHTGETEFERIGAEQGQWQDLVPSLRLSAELDRL